MFQVEGMKENLSDTMFSPDIEPEASLMTPEKSRRKRRGMNKTYICSFICLQL